MIQTSFWITWTAVRFMHQLYRGPGNRGPYSDCYETRFFDDSALAAEFLKFVLVKHPRVESPDRR